MSFIEELSNLTGLIPDLIRMVTTYCPTIWESCVYPIRDNKGILLDKLDLNHTHRESDGEIIAFDAQMGNILQLFLEPGRGCSKVWTRYLTVRREPVFISKKWLVDYSRRDCHFTILDLKDGSTNLFRLDRAVKPGLRAIKVENNRPVIYVYQNDFGIIVYQHQERQRRIRLFHQGIEAITFDRNFIFLLRGNREILLLDRSTLGVSALWEINQPAKEFLLGEPRLFAHDHLYLERRTERGDRKSPLAVRSGSLRSLLEIYDLTGRLIHSMIIDRPLIGVNEDGSFYTGGKTLTQYIPRSLI
jgi:hypothetical protein